MRCSIKVTFWKILLAALLFGSWPWFAKLSFGGTTINGQMTLQGNISSDNVVISGGTVDNVTLGTLAPILQALIDNIKIDGNTISSLDTNGNINLVPNGTGKVSIGGLRLGIGVTTWRNWDPTWNVIQVGDDSAFIVSDDGVIGFVQGMTWDGTGWVYNNTGKAVSIIDLNMGYLVFHTQVAGVAGQYVNMTTWKTLYIEPTEGHMALNMVPPSTYPGYNTFFIGGNASVLANTAAMISSALAIAQNAYLHSSGNWKYQSADEAQRFSMSGGIYTFYTASAGVADGNISWNTSAILSSAGFSVSGFVTGKRDVVNTATSTLALSAGQCKGNIHTNNSGGAIDYTLPSAETGLNCCFYANASANVITIDPYDAADTITLYGIAQPAGNAIDSAGGVGDFMCVFAADTTNWHTLQFSGIWINGGAD